LQTLLASGVGGNCFFRKSIAPLFKGPRGQHLIEKIIKIIDSGAAPVRMGTVATSERLNILP
jgi:hypothetical protein